MCVCPERRMDFLSLIPLLFKSSTDELSAQHPGWERQSLSCWDMRNNRAKLKMRVQLRQMVQEETSGADRSWTAATKEIRMRLAPSTGKRRKRKWMFYGVASVYWEEYSTANQKNNIGKPQLRGVQETPNTKWFQTCKVHCLAGTHKTNATESTDFNLDRWQGKMQGEE